MSGIRRASLANLRRPLAVPLAIAACAAIAACGGGGKATAKVTAARLVSQAFSASHTVDSGHLALSLTLMLDGVKQLAGEPLMLDVSGPFERDGAGRLSADLGVSVTAAATDAKLGIDLAPGHVYLGVGGTFYDLPQSDRGMAGGGLGATGATGADGLFARLGDPSRWLINPRDAGTAEIGGVQTEHLSAGVDVATMLADIAKLLGGTAASGGGPMGSSGPAGSLALAAQVITSARVDIYTGVDDHLLRRFNVAVSFEASAGAAGPLDGLSGGSLDLTATLSDLDKRQTIAPPANVEPSSRLLNGIFDLESQFGSLASLFAPSGSNLGGVHSGSASATS
jgi:hypothetical protein